MGPSPSFLWVRGAGGGGNEPDSQRFSHAIQLFFLIFSSAGRLRSQQSLWGNGCSACELRDCQHRINFPFCTHSCGAIESTTRVLLVQSMSREGL